MVQNCKTLQSMYKNKRSDRYTIIKNPDGIFPVHPYDISLNEFKGLV